MTETAEKTTTNNTETNRGVQADTINGDISIIGSGLGREDLVVRYSTQAEVAEVGAGFVAPDGFALARQRMRDHEGVVVLSGRGSGRSFTARKLLVDRGATTIANLNPERSLGSVRESELTPGDGYIWDLREAGGQPFTDRAFAHCRDLVRAQGCALVVLLDSPVQAPPLAAGHVAPLKPPNALDIAVAVVEQSGHEKSEEAVGVLKSDFHQELTKDLPPQRAVSAAGLALRVVDGRLSLADALRDLREGADVPVAAWFADASPRARTMAFAVALLENESLDEVVRMADKLADLVKRAELPEDKNPRPTKVFLESKSSLVEAVHAVRVERKHPVHDGLTEHTVRFERPDWAAAVLRHVWAEYHVAHEIVERWMRSPALASEFYEPVRRGLCVFISQVPAHDPLRPLRGLMVGGAVARDLAAATLASLSDDHTLRPVVERTLEEWAEGWANQRSVVAMYWSTVVGRRDPERALAALADLAAETDTPQVHGTIIASTLRLLRQNGLREQTMRAITRWATAGPRRGGQQRVAVGLTFYLTGLTQLDWFDSDEILAEFPGQTRFLLARALLDPMAGRNVLDLLFDVGEEVRLGKRGARAELVQLMALVTDDLSWRGRLRLSRRLAAAHPQVASQIRHLLRLAAKSAKQAQASTPAEVTDAG
ncbi:hypothetical protein ACOBQX_24115 [Actinokineospora sp. G85]|uniref:hypothetical protein n=1 Tax=Actinokineospora sp. G85 TaxID=3406626 RepID=UPI003C73E9EC